MRNSHRKRSCQCLTIGLALLMGLIAFTGRPVYGQEGEEEEVYYLISEQENLPFSFSLRNPLPRDERPEGEEDAPKTFILNKASYAFLYTEEEKDCCSTASYCPGGRMIFPLLPPLFGEPIEKREEKKCHEISTEAINKLIQSYQLEASDLQRAGQRQEYFRLNGFGISMQALAVWDSLWHLIEPADRRSLPSPEDSVKAVRSRNVALKGQPLFEGTKEEAANDTLFLQQLAEAELMIARSKVHTGEQERQMEIHQAGSYSFPELKGYAVPGMKAVSSSSRLRLSEEMTLPYGSAEGVADTGNITPSFTLDEEAEPGEYEFILSRPAYGRHREIRLFSDRSQPEKAGCFWLAFTDEDSGRQEETFKIRYQPEQTKERTLKEESPAPPLKAVRAVQLYRRAEGEEQQTDHKIKEEGLPEEGGRQESRTAEEARKQDPDKKKEEAGEQASGECGGERPDAISSESGVAETGPSQTARENKKPASSRKVQSHASETGGTDRRSARGEDEDWEEFIAEGWRKEDLSPQTGDEISLSSMTFFLALLALAYRQVLKRESVIPFHLRDAAGSPPAAEGVEGRKRRRGVRRDGPAW